MVSWDCSVGCKCVASSLGVVPVACVGVAFVQSKLASRWVLLSSQFVGGSRA